MHKARVVERYPFLLPLFEQFAPTGKRAMRVKKRLRSSEAPKGSWYVFVHYLMMENLVYKLCSFRREKKWKLELLVRAVCNSDTASVTLSGDRVEGFRAYRHKVDGWDYIQFYWFRSFQRGVIKTCAETRHVEVRKDEIDPIRFTRPFARLVYEYSL